MVLTVSLKLTPNTYNESPEISKVFSKTYLEFISQKWYIIVFVLYVLCLILYQTSTDAIPEKQSYKRDTDVATSPGYIEVILILFIESIVIKVGLSGIQIGKPMF